VRFIHFCSFHNLCLHNLSFEVPETITGAIGAIIIGLSLYSSVRYNKKEQSL